MDDTDTITSVEPMGKLGIGAKIDAKKYVAFKQYAQDHKTTVAALIDRAIDWILSGGLEAWQASGNKSTDDSNTEHIDDCEAEHKDSNAIPASRQEVWQAVCDAQKAAHNATFGNVDRAIDDWLVALTDALGFALADDKDDAA